MRGLVKKYFDFIKKILPQKQEGYPVGIDIGPRECKAVQLSWNDGGYALLDWVIEPVKGGDFQGCLELIRKNFKNPPSQIYTSVSGRGTLIRYIDMPRMSLNDLRKSFDIEADKYFPFPKDQIYMDCFILDEQNKDKNMPVMIAAAKKELVDSRIQTLSNINVEANFVGINSVALANAFHVLSGDELNKECVGLLDMGESVSNLTIYRNKLPRFTRDIFLGGRDFTKRISNALGVNFDEAEALKIMPSGKKAEVLSACETPIMNLIDELKLSFEYYGTENNMEVTKLLLTGGSAKFTGLAELLKKNLDIDILYWNPLEKLNAGADVKNIDDVLHKLGVALGLALYYYD